MHPIMLKLKEILQLLKWKAEGFGKFLTATVFQDPLLCFWLLLIVELEFLA